LWRSRLRDTNDNTGWVGRPIPASAADDRRSGSPGGAAPDVDASLEHERRASALGGQVLDVETPW
jgi:hypothetical protein